jgi:hypothetical protein
MTLLTSTEPILQQVSAGSREPVLVADFQPFSAAPRLSELLGGRTAGRAVYRVDPISVLSGSLAYASLTDLAEDAVAEFRSADPGNDRIFIIGHCSAAALSLRIAQILRPDRDITVMLVHPTWPDDQHIAARFAEFQARFGGAPQPCPDLTGEPCTVVTQMEQILLAELTALAASQGLSVTTPVFSDLLAWYRAWLAFLLACRNGAADLQVADGITLTVLAENAADAIPGTDPSAFSIVDTPAPDPAQPVTPELAGCVLEHLAAM